MERYKRPLKIYFAGELFDFKHLGGNLLMAEAIEKYSDFRYKVMLPQDGECEAGDRSPQSIRNEDFNLLFECDIILANFDGTDPDSGTVVEFCFAKMVDMPAVLLRSDFRHCGDQTLPGSDPWNLMCSNYPRTRSCHVNAMELYHQCRRTACSTAERLELFCRLQAETVIAGLDAVTAEKSWLKPELAANQYKTAVKSIGGGLEQLLSDDAIAELIRSKTAAGIYR